MKYVEQIVAKRTQMKLVSLEQNMTAAQAVSNCPVYPEWYVYKTSISSNNIDMQHSFSYEYFAIRYTKAQFSYSSRHGEEIRLDSFCFKYNHDPMQSNLYVNKSPSYLTSESIMFADDIKSLRAISSEKDRTELLIDCTESQHPVIGRKIKSTNYTINGMSISQDSKQRDIGTTTHND